MKRTDRAASGTGRGVPDDRITVAAVVLRSLMLLVLVAGAAVTIDAAPAFAHLCAHPAEIPVEQPDTVEIAVTVEATPVPDVEIGIPAPLRVDRVDAASGWKITRAGSMLRYRGGPIAPYSCQYFSVQLTAPVKGHWAIAVTQRVRNGTIVARSGTDPNTPPNPLLDQTVYAGEKPPSPSSAGGGFSIITMLGIAFVALALLVLGFAGFRAWRARHDEYADLDDEEFDAAMRDIEIQDRLAEFKKRTRRRPARR